MKRIPEFGSSRGPIILMKGLPCTRKSFVAEKLCAWSRCEALFMDDFIGDDDDPHAGSWEEAERLQSNSLQRSFTTLCRVGDRHLHTSFRGVIIKSRLGSTSELQQLMRVVGEWGLVLIIECRVRNRHEWLRQFNSLNPNDDDDYRYSRKWYRPRSWVDIEKAMQDHFHPPRLLEAHWDLHLLGLSQRHPNTRFRRLVVDPFYDLDLSSPFSDPQLNPVFCHAINHLLGKELDDEALYAMEFDAFRRFRAEQILNALPSSTRSKDVCGAQGSCCLFKYWHHPPTLAISAASPLCLCGVCGGAFAAGDPVYTCYYCVLALHKPCAEMTGRFDFQTICDSIDMVYFIQYISKSEEKVPCEACVQKGLAFSQNCDACLFQTVVKRGLMPLVVNHEHHPHPLSLRIQDGFFVCKACGTVGWDSGYVCSICEWNYHIQCVFVPREAEHHEHGRHEHVLKLKFVQDDMEEEDYWCDVCYRDLDPYFWFYSCRSCPSFAAHVYCARVYPRRLWRECRREDLYLNFGRT